MKNKKLFVLPFLTCLLSFTSCSGGRGSSKIDYEPLTPQILDDNYRNFYEIFVASFADSNGNGRGDIQGIIDKFDYIKDLGYTGIWLTPIHPSATTHHYDVQDYKAVATDFGTLTKLDNLISKCHENNIKIILDLVINHSSNKHEWFQNSYTAAKAKKTSNQYYGYYNWIDCTGSAPSGYCKVNGNDSIAYEGRFDSTMPDLNLQAVLDDNDGYLATELKDIFKFWLVDHNVDGFRLDAVTSYFTGEPEKNLAFMTWLNQECKALKPTCYIVGEGEWGSNNLTNKMYQESGIDSFFQFGNCAKNTGFISQIINLQTARTYHNALVKNREIANGGIEAPFLGNHDTVRAIGSVQGRGNLTNAKFNLGLLQMMAGATFSYYGDEVGMASQKSNVDGFHRLPIRWGDEYTCDISKLSLYGVNAKDIDEALAYPYADVATQLQDANSLLNYVSKANNLRLCFPEIIHGDSELVVDKSYFGLIKRTYNNSSIYVALNASMSISEEFDYSEYGEKVVAELCPEGNLKYKVKGKSIVIPPQSIAIIK